jgi:hypothetical protein
MIVFPYIEDYLLFFSGRVDNHGKPSKNSWETFPYPVQLATYDVKFVDSAADQIAPLFGIGTTRALTDKQANLLQHLIQKYERQLHKHGVDQPDHKNYKYGTREVNRASELDIVDDKLVFRFPYSAARIEAIREFAKISEGKVAWDHEARVWKFALTEFNLSWVYTMASSDPTTLISPLVSSLFNEIVEVESRPYAIELDMDEEGNPTITNAPESMLDYVAAQGATGDLLKLLDLSGELAYTINPDLRSALVEAYGETFVSFCSQHSIDQTSVGNSLEPVIKWAIATNRLPIVVYNPNFAKHDKELFATYFAPQETQNIVSTSSAKQLDPSAKYVYTTKTVQDWPGKIPLLITYANLMHGASKKEFLSKAAKVCYFCEKLTPR